MLGARAKWDKYISLIQYGGALYQLYAACCFSNGDLAVLKEYDLITLKYNGKACSLDLLCFCASKDTNSRRYDQAAQSLKENRQIRPKPAKAENIPLD